MFLCWAIFSEYINGLIPSKVYTKSTDSTRFKTLLFFETVRTNNNAAMQMQFSFQRFFILFYGCFLFPLYFAIDLQLILLYFQ